MAADRTLVLGEAILAESKRPVGGDPFMQGFEEEKKRQEKYVEDLNNQTKEYMEQFSADIDYLQYKPNEAKLLEDQLIKYQDEFADAASEYAKYENKTSQKARDLKNIMDRALGKAKDLETRSSTYLTGKAEYKEAQQQGLYGNHSQNAQRLQNSNNAYVGGIKGINEEGDFIFEGGLAFKELEKPAFKISKPFNDAVENASTLFGKTKTTPTSDEQINVQVDKAMNALTDDAFYALIGTNQNELFNFDGFTINENKEGEKTEDRKAELRQQLFESFRDIANKSYKRPASSTSRTNPVPAAIQEEKKIREDAFKNWERGGTVVIPYQGGQLIATPRAESSALMQSIRSSKGDRIPAGVPIYDITQVNEDGFTVEGRFPSLEETTSFEEFFQFHTGGVN